MDPSTPRPSTSAVSARLRQLAVDEPDRIAVDEPGRPLTYGQLDRAVDALGAWLLAELGPGRHAVGLRITDTARLLIASLALTRRGLVNVPVDPTAPAERVATILDDVEASLVLSDVDGDDALGLPVPVRALPSLLDDVPPTVGSTDQPDEAVRTDEPVAVVYTSGSTGVPKGVMVGPAQKRLMEGWIREHFPEGVRVGVLGVGTVGFIDPLLSAVVLTGGTIVPFALLRVGLAPLGPWLLEERIEGFATVPTIMRALVGTLDPDQRFPDLRIVVFAGEAPSWDDVRGLRPHLAEDAVIYNGYGTTETGSISFGTVGPDDPLGVGMLPAGPPIVGVEVAVLDPSGAPVAPGEVGEIVVTGDGVSLGYRNRADLTAASFETLPDGRRRYRTGDAGVLRPDGVLEVRGRLDHMVKVAGNRVELGEVEVALRALPEVDQAVVVPKLGADLVTRLGAYVVPVRGASVDPVEVRRALARRLPGPMLPARTVVLAELPRLPNGKVDRRELEARSDPPTGGGAGDRAGSVTERQLAALWQELLGLADVGADDDFFDLGGDSMLAVQLFAELERRHGVARRTSLLLEARTVRLLAAAIDGHDDPDDVLVAVRPDGDRPPVFVIHAGAGGVMFARDLAGRLPDQPVYGIQPPPLVDGRPPDATLEDLAARYVGAVRRVRPDGPYFLAGLSLGGLVAYEMALQLQRDGAVVGGLLIGDALPPGVLRFDDGAAVTEVADLRRTPADRARHRVRALRSMPIRRGAPEALAVARRAVGRSIARRRRAWWEVRDRQRGTALLHAYGALAVDYRPVGRFDGRPLLVRSTTRHPGSADLDLGWSGHTTDGVRVLPVDGPHDRLLNEPHVAPVAAALVELVEAALR